jgi:ATP/ADP translocase
MKSWYLRPSGLRPDEVPRATAFGAMLFGNALATQVSGIAAISGFLNDVGVAQMIPVWLVSYTLILGLSGVQSLMVDRWDRRRLLGWATLSFAAAFLVIQACFTFGAPPWISYSLMYLTSDQQWLFFPLLLWTLAGDTFEGAQARRIFPVISSLGSLGKLVGIGVAAASPSILALLGAQAEDVVVLNIALYLALYGISRWQLGSLPPQHRPAVDAGLRQTLAHGVEFVQRVPAFKFLTLSALALACCDLIVEYQFYLATDAAFPTTAAYTTFFGVYRLVFTLAALAIQGFLVQRLIQRLGMKNAFLVQPFASLAGALGILAMPSIATAVAGNVLQKLPHVTLDESARKNLLTLVPEEMRGRVSILIDSYMFAIGSILGALILGIVVAMQVSLGLPGLWSVYMGLAAAAAIFALWSTLQMRRTYEASMLSGWLKRRRRAATVLDRLEDAHDQARIAAQ